MPNLFRKLFGEGALSAAFIPMYARMTQVDRLGQPTGEAQTFAAGSVNLLVTMLAVIVLVGELILGGIWLMGVEREDYRLAVVLSAIMLPYVVLICGAAFLGGILNVHEKFTLPALASVLLNVCLIAAIGAAAFVFDLATEAGRTDATKWLALAVVVSGVLQVMLLWPGLKRVGFGFDWGAKLWTPQTRRMLAMSIPVAISAGVLQISVLLDKSLAFFLASGDGQTSFSLLGQSIRFPMEEGAAARLNWAQFMYQFPLGVFAIALATAIFPKLSRDAATNDGRSDDFRDGLRRGVEAALYIGLPASVGLMLVSTDAVRVLFERGEFTAMDTRLVAASTAVYAAAIWAFSMQQIVNRAYYALHDTRTPLVFSLVNLGMNVAIELPLMWALPAPFGEVGMACGTLVSFSLQAMLMLWLLSRRVGGLGLRKSFRPVAVMLLASFAMAGALLSVRPLLPTGPEMSPSAIRLATMIAIGAAVYFGLTKLAIRRSPMRTVR
ncbi:MAG: murein biosynthesis integral membrane protein MurJ [Planctomycetota bacterium]